MWRFILVMGSAATLTACIARPVERDSELATADRWTAVLVPADGGTIYGSAVVMRLAPGSARVTISLAGSRNGAAHPWDIHQGTCGDDGPVVGASRIYPPVPIGGSGAATMMTELPLELRSGGAYYVNVHESPLRERIVSCGALSRNVPITAQARSER